MTRRLYRSRDDKVLGGVAAGLANYFGLDPTIVRLVWVLLTLWGGTGLALYVVAWIIVPEEPGGYEAATRDAYEGAGPRRVQSPGDRRTLGWLLIVVGGAVLLFNTPFFSVLSSPTVIIGGALVIWGLFTIGRADRRPPRVR